MCLRRTALWIVAGVLMCQTILYQDAVDGTGRWKGCDPFGFHFLTDGFCATWQAAVIETESEEDDDF